MDEHEPEWMRDKRLRDEEARMVQLESNVGAIKVQVDSILAISIDERKLRRAAEEALLKHEADDSTRFSSIDSRLQGIQTQLSSINESQKRIEKGAETTDERLKVLEKDATGRTAVSRWLKSAWVQLGIGASIGGSLVAAYALLA